jgi:hypothetical protein
VKGMRERVAELGPLIRARRLREPGGEWHVGQSRRMGWMTFHRFFGHQRAALTPPALTPTAD